MTDSILTSPGYMPSVLPVIVPQEQFKINSTCLLLMYFTMRKSSSGR